MKLASMHVRTCMCTRPLKRLRRGGEKEENCFHVFKEIRRGAKSHLLKTPPLPLMKTNFSMGGIHFLLLPPSLPKQAAKGCTLMLPTAAAYIIFFLLGTPPHFYDPVSQWLTAHGSDLGLDSSRAHGFSLSPPFVSQ